MPKKFEVNVKPKESKVYTMSIWDDLEEYEDYDKLIEVLNKVNESDHVTLNVSSPGGRCDIGFMLIDKFQALPCRLDIIVPYPTYSMGALMSLMGDSLEIKPGSFLMFHDYSGGGGRAKGNETLKATEAYCEVFKHRFNAVCHPFLTKRECEDVQQGKDLYIKWNDPTLEQRMKRHFGA